MYATKWSPCSNKPVKRSVFYEVTGGIATTREKSKLLPNVLSCRVAFEMTSRRSSSWSSPSTSPTTLVCSATGPKTHKRTYAPPSWGARMAKAGIRTTGTKICAGFKFALTLELPPGIEACGGSRPGFRRICHVRVLLHKFRILIKKPLGSRIRNYAVEALRVSLDGGGWLSGAASTIPTEVSHPLKKDNLRDELATALTGLRPV